MITCLPIHHESQYVCTAYIVRQNTGIQNLDKQHSQTDPLIYMLRL